MRVHRVFFLPSFACMAFACAAPGAPTDSAPSAIATCFAPAATDAPDKVIASWLHAQATDAANAYALLGAVERIVGDAKLVGLGEPDHGFHEFPALRNAVVEMLIDKHDFRALTLETGIIEAHVVDQYVLDVEGKSGMTLDRVLAEGFTHEMGAFEETRDLVAWVRTHNEQAAKNGKALVHWGGKDLSVLGDTLAVPLAAGRDLYAKLGISDKVARLSALADKASAVTQQVEGAVHSTLHVDIDPDHLDAVASVSYDQLGDDERVEIGKQIEAILADFDAHAADYAAKTSKDDVDFARTTIAVARQMYEDLEGRIQLGVVYGPTNSAGNSLDFLKKVYEHLGQPLPAMPRAKFITGSYTPEQFEIYEKARNSREKHLAENVAALVARYGKTFNFAASSHLQKTAAGDDGGKAAAEGQFLADQFKADYVLIGGAASTFIEPQFAELRSREMARPGSLEDYLGSVGSFSSYVVDVRPRHDCAPPKAVSDWLDAVQLTWIGKTKFSIVPGKAYDAIYWVKTATPAIPVDR